MTIIDHAVGNGHTQGAKRRTKSDRAISQEDLVELVLELRDEARRRGERIPGRPALAEAIGVKPHRVRAALAELQREHRQARPNGRLRARDERAQANGSGNVRSPIGATGAGAGADRDANHGAVKHPPANEPDAQDKDPVDHSATGWRDATGSVPTPETGAPAGAAGFYVVAAMSLLVSMNTSWRFFENNLHITDLVERTVMFAVLEVALVACGWGMRANVRRTGRPGAPRLFAWLLCGMSGYMAWLLSGPSVGIARVALGPALGIVMLHLALGIEIKARHARTTTWARIGRELRERLLSRLGLADDQRDAMARTRQRAAARVAKLSLGTTVWFRTTRVKRALRASNAAHDPAARNWLLAELAATRHATDLATLPQPSPWKAVAIGGASLEGSHPPR